MARAQARRRQRERLGGILLAVVGVVVLVVAVLALTRHKSTGDSHDAAASSSQHSTHSSPRPSTSASSPRRHASSSPRPSRRASSSSGAGGTSGTSGTDAAAKSVPLVVLNNTTTQGLAGQAAQRFESGGWKVSSEGNLQNDIISTCAYYDPSSPGAEAAAQALQRQYPTIKRVEPKFAELPGGPVVVVLTPDYSSG